MHCRIDLLLPITLGICFVFPFAEYAVMGQEIPSQSPGTRQLPVIADLPSQIDSAQFLDAKLTEVATVRFEDTSLDEVAAWVRQATGWNVVIDATSFNASDVLSIEPIEESIQDQPIYLLLDRLSRYGVAWHAQNSMITFHRIDDPSGIVSTQFPVGDLLDNKVLPSSLLECVQTIDARNWESSDGGAIMLGDVLFVRQYSRTNRRIACLLAALRAPARRTFVDDATRNSNLRQALEQLISVNIQQKSLAAVATELSNLAGIDVRIDLPGLKESRISERTPVSLEIVDQRLRVVLDLLTEQYGLGWQIRDGVAWITAKEVVESNPLTAVYDVRDLCRDFDESFALEDAVKQQSGPESWEDGQGTIHFPIPGVMVVNQTEARHNDILQLLEAYRTALLNSKPRVDADSDPEKVIMHFYRMPTAVAEELVTTLPELVASGHWKTNESPDQPGTIRLLASWNQLVYARKDSSESGTDNAPPLAVPYSVLVVNQRRKFHPDIHELLRKIEHGDTSAGGMGGQGSFGGGMFNVRDVGR